MMKIIAFYEDTFQIISMSTLTYIWRTLDPFLVSPNFITFLAVIER